MQDDDNGDVMNETNQTMGFFSNGNANDDGRGSGLKKGGAAPSVTAATTTFASGNHRQSKNDQKGSTY